MDQSDLTPAEVRRMAGMEKVAKHEFPRPKRRRPPDAMEFKRIAALFPKRSDKSKPA